VSVLVHGYAGPPVTGRGIVWAGEAIYMTSGQDMKFLPAGHAFVVGVAREDEKLVFISVSPQAVEQVIVGSVL